MYAWYSLGLPIFVSKSLQPHYYPVTIETVGIIVRRFGTGTVSTFEG